MPILKYLGIKLAIVTIVTGLAAAVALPITAHLTADAQQDLEVEPPELVALLAPVQRTPLLGVVPGAIAAVLGILALALGAGRIPLAILGMIVNLIAVGLCMILVFGTLAPLYEYRPL